MWLRDAKHQVAIVLAQISVKYGLKAEYFEGWLGKETHADFDGEFDHHRGSNKDRLRTATNPESPAKQDARVVHVQPTSDDVKANEEDGAASVTSAHHNSHETIRHIGYNKEGSPVVLVEFIGTALLPAIDRRFVCFEI